MPLSEVMTSNPFTIGINEPFSRVWDKLKTHKIRHLPVLDSDNRLRGIISQRDLYRVISPRKNTEGNFIYDKEELDRCILQHIMVKDVKTLAPDDTMGRAIDLMVRKKYGCIPIVDSDNVLKGIITQIDILKKVSQYFI